MAIIQIRFNVDSIAPDQCGSAGFVQPIEGHGEHPVKIESNGTRRNRCGEGKSRDAAPFLLTSPSPLPTGERVQIVLGASCLAW
jgi:hypothetical protein